MPEIKSVYKEYRETRLEIIGISLDEEKDDQIAALNEHNSNWLNVSDLKGWDSEAAEIYGVVQTPTFFLINQKMIIEKNNSDLNSIQSHLKSWKNKKRQISYELPNKSHELLVIYDLLGNKIKILVNESQSLGKRIVVWME